MWRFDLISQSYEVAKFWIQHTWCHTCKCKIHFTCGFDTYFCQFHRKRNFTKFYGVLDYFSQAYEVRTFWMIKLSWCKWHDSRKFVNYGLHGKLLEFLVNVNFLYDYRGLFFKKNMLLWPQVSFKTIVLTKSDVTRFGIFAKIIFKFSTFLPQSEWPKVEQKSSQNFFWKFLDL